MFKTELTIEEEVLLTGILSNEKLSRNEVLHKLSSTEINCEDVTLVDDLVSIKESLFNKLKNTSDCEFKEYRDILLNAPV